MNFSQRNGLKPVRTAIQRESIDDELRTALWNNLTVHYFGFIEDYEYKTPSSLVLLLKRIWIHYFKGRLDEFPELYQVESEIKGYFFGAKWNEVLDLIEYIISNYTVEIHGAKNHKNLTFIDSSNAVLEHHVSAYRIIDFLVVEITAEEEIKSIEKALESTNRLAPVHAHISRALELMSDRKSPDYRNSIKESISAVESLCIMITGRQKATLGQALDEIEKKNKIHPALRKSFASLYGYTSDSGGIRHALMGENSLSQDDSRYMLVSCTTFINYLIAKFQLV